MSDMLLGVSPDYLYYTQQKITPVTSIHQPYFLAFNKMASETKSIKKQLQNLHEKNTDVFPWTYITEFGDIEQYNSFWHSSKKIHAFPIFVKQSFRVPEISDHLFFKYNVFTAEHDIPYHQRVLVDIAARKNQWMYDTHGKKQSISMLIYDIEMSDFIPGKIDGPIDIIGFARGDLSFHSSKDLETESFDFDFDNIPHVVEEDDIIQLVSRNEDEELDHLIQFCRTIPKYDIISGHNIIGFDNRQVYGRVKKLIGEYQSSLSKKQLKPLQDFLQLYTRLDTSFHFGVGSDVVQIYPSGFDTYLAARKFYPYLDSHSLKSVAPFLGYGVENRLILSPEEITLNDTTLRYNRQDIIEQMGV
jgi:DNA polymerase elongation subunit (family B)